MADDTKGSALTVITALDDADKIYIIDLTGPSSKAISAANIRNDILDKKFTAAEGFLRKIAGGSYVAIKSNLAATVDPTANEDSGDGYAVGSIWINTTGDKSFVCVDATVAAAVWKETSAGAGGGEANTASNSGVGGVGVFARKTGVDLEFKNINSDATITVTDDPGNDEIDLSVPDGGITLAKMADIATARILGRITAATGVVEALTATQVRSLLNVEDGADVTDAANVDDAGAVMDSDISAAEGFMRKTGAGTYVAIKSNLAATVDPTANEDSGDGYAVGSIWINTTGDKSFVCVDATVAAAVWKETSAGAGGGIGSVVEDTTPQLGGMLDVNGQSIGDGALELLMFIEVASAVNEVTIKNAATGNAPELQATGDNADIDLNLVPKGTGKIKAGGKQVGTVGRQTVVIPIGAANSTATAGGPAIVRVEAATNDVNYDAGDLDASADEHYYFNFKLPLSWNAGTITYRAFWTTAATGTTGIALSLKARAVGDNEAIDGAWGTPVVVTDDAQSGAGKMLVTAESAALTIGNTPTVDKMIFFDLLRDVSDANDDMTEDARLLLVEIYFTTNKAEDL